MTINIEYLEDGGIISRVEGSVTGTEIKEANDIIYGSSDKIKKIVYQIADLTNATDFNLSTSELMALSSQDENAAKINPNMFIAIVGKKDAIYGLARMWEAFSYKSPFETMVFRKMEDAQQWIRGKLPKKP
ncbi:MAG: hypothetical protein KJO26_13885 [Deltaproteobacteria bacterium]|nr:hypothetical protein [Deltaproteobacteria bacterium]MBT8357080.1 hypothetical protein [Deltaproteobacteria bacterium]NNK85715.1 hypothetical protein [Desulfobacterales bacterium]NNL41400.1 hypothetical protein [Desulfobacterales bacterium]